MASMHCYKRSEEDCYDDNKSNCKPNHQSQQYASHGQNHGYGQGYGSSGYGPQYSSHPDGVKSETVYYSETTKTCYDDQYGMGKPNSAMGHNYGTGGKPFVHRKEPKQYSMGQGPFGFLKDHHSGTHQTGYDSYGYANMGCNEKSGMKLKGKSGYRKKNKDGYGSCSGSDSD